MKKITVTVPCFNEAENIFELYDRLCKVFKILKQYQFEVIFIDNCSSDRTLELLKNIALTDERIKIISNVRNFGPIRSPYWAVMQSSGDATIAMAADLQDPPELIPEFLGEWERGWKVVMAVKPTSQTNILMHIIRKTYYRFLTRISSIDLIQDATGFGLYDSVVVKWITKIHDPYPYFRGLISELGYPVKTIAFNQPRRARGVSGNNFYSLYELAMLGIVNHSLVPIRAASFLGFFIAAISFIIALIYLGIKLIYWDRFPLGIAPLVIGSFLMFGILFLFIGLLGEYIGSIHTYVRNRPVVVESERINF